MKTAIVIPAFNESATIGKVVRDVAAHGLPIVVDDMSSDGTADIAADAGAEVVRRGKNGGYDAAIQSGFERAEALGMHAVSTFDADGQHMAEILADLFAPIRAGRVRLVLGIRPEKARFSEVLFGLYTRLRYGLPDILCGMKAYSMDLYREHGCFDSTRSIGTELALWALRAGEPFETVAAPTRKREGRSRFGSVVRGNLKILRAMFMAMAGGTGGRRAA